jgi:hypothetical protein
MKIKKNNVEKKANVFDSQRNRMILGGVIAAALLLMVILMFIENSQGKIVISNNSGTKIEYVQVYFVSAEGPLHEGFRADNLEAGKAQSFPIGENKLLGAEANLEVRFKFEGSDEVFVDAGYFNDTFHGNITVDFRPAEEPDTVNLHVKAANSLLKSKLIDCDDEFKINIAEGYEIE